MAGLLSAGGGGEAARGTCAHPASVANAASLRTSLRRLSTAASEDLVDRVDRALGAPIAARYSEKPVQKHVLRMPGLEARRGPDVVGRGLGSLATRECLNHPGRT